MKKIVCLFVVFFMSLMETSAASDLNTAHFFYHCYQHSGNNYKLNTITDEEYRELPKGAKQDYKQVIKADKFWKKGLKYSKNDKRRYKNLEKAFSVNHTLFPVADELALYYLSQNNIPKAEYYLSKIPLSFDRSKNLKLSLVLLSSNRYNDAIHAAKEYLKQKETNKENNIVANYVIMKSYFSFYIYDEALKYANILIYNFPFCHYYQREAWDTRYKCYLYKKDYKNALNTAIQMAKKWGYKEDFEKIKVCTEDKKTRLSSYNLVKKDHLKRKTDRVTYINSLIEEEHNKKTTVQTVQKVKKSSSYPLYSDPLLDLFFFSELVDAPSAIPTPVNNQRVHYGYNAYGNYVPTFVGNKRIQYGYNAVGDYVPTSIGNQRIHYGYNAYGDFVPMSVGD